MGTTPPEISKRYDHEIFTTCWYPDGGTKHKKNLTYLTWSVNYRLKSRKFRCLEMQFLDKLTSQNLAGLSILTSEMNPENFRQIFHKLICKMPKNLVCQIQNGPYDAKCVTWLHQIYWVMPCHPYLDTDQKVHKNTMFLE